jgi:hypothetical protein
MRFPALIVPVILSTSGLLSCGDEQQSTDVDPSLGLTCFEALQPALPPGSQYEGLIEVSENRITVRAMTGTKVESFKCSQEPDGTVSVLAD